MNARGAGIEEASPGLGARREAALRVAATAVLVAIAYYVGANAGFILGLPPSTPSVLWLPNAILTATLLLTPVKRWWIYLLAAFPAHVASKFGAPLPPLLVLALFATNCSEALVAAVCVRRFSDAPTRFDTLRRVAVFIGGAVLIAPFVSSFADAAVVSELKQAPYWLVWRTRFIANALTELTLVPAIVGVVTARSSWGPETPLRRYVEAGLLALAMTTVGTVVMEGLVHGPSAIPGAPYTPLVTLLPFILWAAVRFGPGGASLSLLCTVLLAIVVSVHGRPAATAMPSADSVTALQILLFVVAIPFMCLAAVFDERRRSNEALADRLRFEELLVRLSSTFVHLPSHEVETALETSVAQLGEFLELDRVTLYRLSRDAAEEFAVAYTWSAPRVRPLPRVSPRNDFPWIHAQLLRERPVGFSHPGQLPPEARTDAETFRRRGIRSNLSIPMVAGGRILGTLAFVTLTVERAWPDELVQRLRLIGEVFANALAQQENEDTVRSSELMKSAILASLKSDVAVLDREGVIVTVNDGWMRFERENGGMLEACVGASYLDAWRHAADKDVPHAAEALAGTQAVLDRSSASFALEYPCRESGYERWFAISVVPLNVPGGGAVVSRSEITERKRAELEVQLSRQELAHFSRVSMMGELTASLAHELNQPLTGILANAQAALRFLDATPPDLPEIRAILSDIVDDDKRAGEVIRRLRGLLRKEDVRFRAVDLNVLIRDVAKLLTSDAVIRNIAVRLELAPDPVLVSGDSVQLQQVVLNLLLNAMESMAECAEDGRSITVRTENTDVDAVHVSVQDAGTGFHQGTQHLVFEPFYTTKPSGMGMGLAISKSIIEAHGGLIWAEDNSIAGATFHFSLPTPGARSE
ncbi:MAG TPA: MASE1 domain-containing protein [Methylomirabilota bacterium]|nr:MASE1 domain-containing protein [Methylomirabilota bacterium]